MTQKWSTGSNPGPEGRRLSGYCQPDSISMGKEPSFVISVLGYLKNKESWRAALPMELLRHLKINSLALGGAFSEIFHRSFGKETSIPKVPKEPLPAQWGKKKHLEDGNRGWIHLVKGGSSAQTARIFFLSLAISDLRALSLIAAPCSSSEPSARHRSPPASCEGPFSAGNDH